MNRLTLALSGASLLLAGCAFRTLDSNLERIDDLATVVVEITGGAEREKPVLVILADAEALKRVNLEAVYGSREARLRCPAGRYYLCAYEDSNENFAYDEGEPVRFWGEPDVIVVEPAVEKAISLRVDGTTTSLTPHQRGLIQTARSRGADLKVDSVGRRASLDDERFARENAELGGWKPAEFVFNRWTGIYLLEDYDPARTPVLFVHGIFGTPRDFRTAIDQLDRERFQPWVYFYPSSLRLDDLGRHLAKELHLLRLQHRAPRIALVAHSMGGLVARRTVAEYAVSPDRDYLCTLVTIASPLAGMPSAALGAEWAPTAMPCWYDLAPGSPFLSRLFEQSLPEDVPYHMFFGFGEGDGDGTVHIKSQLRPDAMDQATGLHAIDADHVGILSDPRTLERLARILEACASR